MSSLTVEQYQFCSFCRSSHVDKDKHIYSKRHRNLLKSVLKRFSSKIDICKNGIEQPMIQNLIECKEHHKIFWCYFCELDISQHVINDDWVILDQGFLFHLTSKPHENNTRDFFRKNCIKDYRKFLLSETDFKRHLTNTQIALEVHKAKHQQEKLKEMKRISETERKRKNLSHFAQNYQSAPEANKSSVSKNEPRIKGKKTLAVISDGLTCINLKDDNGTGNIYTDSLPPWLQNSDPHKNDTIGPTLGDFETHLKNQKKQKLPEERVGANFDKNISPSDLWLPSFGQVWNNKRRLQTKQDFLKRVKRTQTVTPSAKGLGIVKPYKRKRPLNKETL